MRRPFLQRCVTMSDDTTTIAKPLPGLTSEQARDVRARALRFVLDCHAKKKAAETSGGEDNARKELYDTRAERILRQ